MARQRRHSASRRRRGQFRGLYLVLSVLAAAAALLAACVVFFRVNTVTVEGNERYTDQEIIVASGIRVGDNLAALPKGKIAAGIRAQLPYVESVTVRRRLPDGVLLSVSERQAAASVDSDNGRWLISSQGKLLEHSDGESVLSIIGLRAQTPYAGGSIQVAQQDAGTLNYVLELLTALENHEMLSACTRLDCTAPASMTLAYDLYEIKFPRGGDYEGMLRLLESALASEQMPQDVPGTFDLTVEDGKAYFKPKRS